MPKQTERLIGGFIEHAPLAIAMFDPDMRYLAASTRWNEDYSLDKDVVGRSHYDVFPEISERWKEIHRRALAGETLRSDQELFVRHDGSKQWLRWEVQPWYGAQNELGGLIIFSEDITDRVKAVEVLRESEERFRLVASITNDLILDCDLKSGTVWWNEGLFQNFGYDPVSFGTDLDTWTARIVPTDQKRVADGIGSLVGPDGSKWRDEYRIVRADGRTAVVVDNRTVIRDEHGTAVRMLGSITDVTDRHDLDDRLRQSQKLEAVGQLTGGVAHDFNNLLTVILGNAEILTENLTHDHKLRLLAEMTALAAERGAELTKRLLAFARRQALEPKAVDINKLLSGMDSLLRRTSSEDIEIEVVHAGGLWSAMIDPGQLESAVLNLVVNAQHAMQGGGCLTIETANASLDDAYANENEEVTSGQYVMVSISDTGTGMDAETLQRAFEPFFTTKEVGKGSGLGLSMVYGFIKQSNGHVKLYSEVGQGTTVKLYLPRATSKTDLTITPRVAEPTSTGSETILLVEDDNLVREYATAMVSGLGYRVIGARNGPEALDVLRQIGDIDLLFTDVVMPGGLNGRKLAEKARELHPNMAVLFTSGYTENAIVHHGRLDRGLNLLSKPYRRQDLAAKLRLVLDAHKPSIPKDT
jgi:PAS domain S-box-containing protein